MASFAWKQHGDFRVLASAHLSAQGIEHGFIGTSADFSVIGRQTWLPRFKEQFAVSKVVLLDQLHGDKIVTYPSRELAADGILVPRSALKGAERTAFGIVVADCLAVFLVAADAVCLVHAGWRGLAKNIHKNGLNMLRGLSPNSEIQTFIWPCASLARYEVGPEVIEAVGVCAKTAPGANGKSFLGLSETAGSTLAQDLIYISQECTISDTSFHSYRRDGARAGRNLAFVIL